jgi:hypothetical protein
MSGHDTPIRSRRRPRLRLAGGRTAQTRHAAFLPGLLTNGEDVIEVFTFDEMLDDPWSLPLEDGWILPGIGWLRSTTAAGRHEADDIGDVQQQAARLWHQQLRYARKLGDRQ